MFSTLEDYMKKNLTVFIYVFLCLFVILFQTCDTSEVNAPQDFISGDITFTDSNLISIGGYYAVSLFPDQSNPFNQSPVRSDSLKISVTNHVASAYYKMQTVSSGIYYVGVTWIRNSDKSVRGVLGTYGCDTTHNCSNSQKVEVPSYSGTGGKSFIGWTDTLKKVF